MKCIIIFDHLNDVLYIKYDKAFKKHITEVAVKQNLIEPEKGEEVNGNVLMQIFAPLITSQRIMNCQFGNSYTSIQCNDGLNIVFNEYMGYLFLQVGSEDEAFLKRSLGVCIMCVRHICGGDVSLLKSDFSRSSLLSHLMDVWVLLRNQDQSVLIEAIEQLIVNSELASGTLKALQEAAEQLKKNQQSDTISRMHMMVLVQNKFMSLYSSRNANDLSPSDVMFITFLSVLSTKYWSGNTETEDGSSDEESTWKIMEQQTDSVVINSEKFENIITYKVLLMGDELLPQCIPNYVHVIALSPDVHLIVVIQIGNTVIASGIYEMFHYLNAMQSIQMQNSDMLRPAFDDLDNSVKKVVEAFKKIKQQHNALALAFDEKKLSNKWDAIRKKYMELLKTGDADCLVRIESNTAAFIEVIKEMFYQVIISNTSFFSFDSSLSQISDAATFVNKKLAAFNDFLKVKALRNFTMGSRASLTINKYLEEFPGLVHFMYIDRTNHRVTAPSLDFTSEETVSLTKKKIWWMVQFAHSHLQAGHLAFMWKDTTFNYAYFIWFEDTSGSPLKPKVYPANSGKSLPLPGILSSDFYKKLIEICFPKQSANKIRCYELYCIHLGLATASCVLEHSRRLAATIYDVTGVPNHPMDLL